MTIEYAQINSNPNFMIYEKQYNPKVVVHKNTKKDKTAVVNSKENKNKLRKDELIRTYNIIRSLPYSMAIEVKLNKDEAEEVVEEEPPKPVTPAEIKPKGKK